MSWGESPQQQPNPEQDPYSPWGAPPTGPEGTIPFGAQPPPAQPYPGQSPPAQSVHDAQTQVYGSLPPGQSQQYGPQAQQYGPQAGPPSPYGTPQQPYDAPPYGAAQSPYGAPQQPYGAPQQPYGAPQPYGTPPPPPKKGNGLLIGLVVGAVVIIGGGVGAYIAFHKSAPIVPVSQSTSQPPAAGTATTSPADPTTDPATTPADDDGDSGTVSLPQSVDGYSVIDNSTTEGTVSQIKQNEASSSVFTSPVIAVYGTDSSLPFVNFVDQAVTDDSPVANDSPDSVVSELLNESSVSGIQAEDTSADDGALSCGTITVSNGTANTCAWDDENSVGFIDFNTQISISAGASLADDLRSAAEGD
jgi:hypothetical protein